MHKTTDPTLGKCYKAWLGIDTQEAPPDYYQLLGLSSTESERSTIENAAKQRSIKIRKFQEGKYAAYASLILKEIAKAAHCLLDAKSKAAYDSSRFKKKEEPMELMLADDDPPAMNTKPSSPSPSSPSRTVAPTSTPSDIELPSLADAELSSLLDAPPSSNEFFTSASKALPQGSWKFNIFSRLEPKAYILLASCVLLIIGLVFAANALSNLTWFPEGPKEIPVVAKIEEAEKTSSPSNSSLDFWPTKNRPVAEEETPEEPSNPFEEEVELQPKITHKPFAKLKKEVDLPSLSANDSRSDAETKVSLGMIPPDRISEVAITVTPKSALSNCPLTFKVEPSSDSESSRAWDIVAGPKNAKSAKTSATGAQGLGSTSVVAQLRFIEDELEFLWHNVSIGPELEHLRFCSLTFSVGGFSHIVLLRTVPTLDPIVLNFAGKRQAIPVRVAPLPPGAEVSFEVWGADNISAGFQLSPPDGMSRTSKSVIIKSDPFAFTVSITEVPSLTVAVAGKYKVRNENYDVLMTQFEEHLLGISSKLQNDEALRIRCIESGVVISNRMRYLESIALASSNLETKVVAEGEWKALAAEYKVLNATVRRVLTSRPLLQADYIKVQEIAGLAKSLVENQIQIRLRIKATLGKQTFDVAKFGEPQTN